jgi:indolepyruvate ferredoxin oxidoreductase
MIVIEERRSFLEKNIRDAIFHELPQETAAEIAGRLYGKRFPGGMEGVPDTRGLNYSVLAQRILPLIEKVGNPAASLPAWREGLDGEMARLRAASKPRLRVFDEKVVSRTPTFCPGCPHRDSSSVLLQIRKDLADPEYMRKTHNTEAVDLVAHGDTGCYTMLMFAPTEQLMHNYSGMGLGGGTGSGIDPFITNKQIVFMGDGTFFHSGQIAISNAIKAGQDLTFIILENGTTAMTGHQEHAGTEIDLMGNRSYIQDIYSIVSGMKGSSELTVTKINPAERSNYRKTLEETILRDGVKVIIADKECGITYHRRKFKEEKKTIKEHGYLPRKVHMNVTPEVCENCLECTKQTACPGLTSVDTDYGKKIDTDLTWCVNDGACERVRASNEYGHDIKPCPSFEQITVVRKKRRRYTLPHMALDKLPEPTYVAKLDNPGDEWRCHLAGVGGMGVGLVGALLVRAGHKEGYHVLFMDKKGLAIRNGGVYAQLTFVKSDVNNDHNPDDVPKVTASIPYGKADLLLGVDVLEAARAIDPREQFRVASAERTAAVLNLHKQNTVFALLGKDDFDPDALRQEIYDSCREDLSFAKNLSEICEQRLGSKQFVNIMILGVAYQLGLIPVSHHAIAWAIKDSIRRDHRRNLKAFNIGRKLALEPRMLPMKPQPITWDQLLTNKSRILRKSKFFGRHHADRFEQLVQTNVKLMRDLPEQGKYDLALRIYDLIQYQDEAYTRRYLDLIRSIYKRDSKGRGYRATLAAIWGLAKVMLIKDEPYVAYLLTRWEKKQRDNAKYNIDKSNGDRIIYRHHTKPDLGIGKWRFRLNITTTDWQLRLVRHMKWWRKIPGWHTKEAHLRDWYMGLVGRVDLNSSDAYDRSVQWLSGVNDVTGYREVRYPKQDRYMAAIEAEMAAPAPGTSVPVREFETVGVAK